ncbi:MAG: glycoside hydrolase [Firmicutes bacterium]|nr:glycoside hydrolase [Bacillota bacterium]MCM1400981.1 glycoside hydrolase [Bacteroides sp.]MCM1476504.1 glycoside hydrolase [Bacteroides sp.]
MSNKTLKLFFTVCALMLCGTLEAAPSGNGLQPGEMIPVYRQGESGSRFYRIPALAVCPDGTLVALADKRGDRMNDLPNTISVVAKRSTDGGLTWSEAITVAQGDSARVLTYGDPALAVDPASGRLVAVFSGDEGFWGSTKERKAGFYVSTSDDCGLTWSEPRSITHQIYQKPWYGAFAASGRMLACADGRLMFVANTRLSPRHELKDVYEFVCSSSDGGDTWTVLNPDGRTPANGIGNESKLVELADGTLIMSIRSKGHRRFARSTDGGRSWSADSVVNDLVEPDCNGDIVTAVTASGRQILVHSLPANPDVRRDASLYFSADGGKTWPRVVRLCEGLSAYTSVAQLPDGTLGCLVEVGKWDGNIPGPDGFDIFFTRVAIPDM